MLQKSRLHCIEKAFKSLYHQIRHARRPILLDFNQCHALRNLADIIPWTIEVDERGRVKSLSHRDLGSLDDNFEYWKAIYRRDVHVYCTIVMDDTVRLDYGYVGDCMRRICVEQGRRWQERFRDKAPICVPKALHY